MAMTCAGAMIFAGGCAHAEILIACGETSGKSLLLGSSEGWADDRITEGSIILTQGENGNLDIMIKDSLGWISAIGSGSQVQLVDAYEGYVTVLVNYVGGSKELYTFDFNRRMVFWSQHKFGVLFDKVQTFTGDCDPPP